MQSPIIEELSEELEGQVITAKLNVDDEPEIASSFSVMSIPTLILIKNGKAADRKTGVTSKSALLSMINAVRV
jgi:thioredoxin 1